MALAHLGLATVANAVLMLVQPNPAVPATFVGNGGYSADGLGQTGTGGTVQAEVPAGSTVVQAYLYGTYFTLNPSPADLTIDFDGTVVVLTRLPHSGVSTLSTARTDVTAQVAAKVGGGGGITDFAVNSDPASLDGVALVVIFSNPALPETTIALLDGSGLLGGDTTTFNFAAPLDKTIPGFSAVLSVGSGFSFQGNAPASDICGTGSNQSSLIDVNGARLTSCAGNFDDGAATNGALITVGGVGDSVANPADPFQQPADGAVPRVEDDELYDVEPFLAQNDTQVTFNTRNPSSNDNLFLVIIAITARATVNAVDCPNVVATITGTPGDDKIAGTTGDDIIFGLGGNDQITGMGGNDIICGGDGNDDISGSDGNDQLYGGGGADRLSGGNGDDQLVGGPGADQFAGSAGDDTLDAQDGAGGDVLNGGPQVTADSCLTDPGDIVQTC